MLRVLEIIHFCFSDYEDDFQDIDDSDLLDIQNTQSEYNKKKIADIDERIFNKTQAHQVISSQHADSNNTKVCTCIA